MSKYNHKGIDIAFDADKAQFTARLNGKLIKAPSLDAMKKKVEKETKFEPFKALEVSRNSMSEYNIIGTKKVPDRYGSSRFKYVWLSDRGHERHNVILDTPENRKLIKAYLAEQAKVEKQTKMSEDKLRKHLSTIPVIRPETEAKK